MTEMASPPALEAPWTIAQLAGACTVSEAFIRKCIKAGSLAVHRVGRVVRIAGPEARRFAAELGAVPSSPAHQAHQAHGAHSAYPVKLKLAQRGEGA